MNVDAKKLVLIEKILHTKREDVLEQLQAILDATEPELRPEQKSFLDERLADPREGEDWEVVKARLRRKA
jgi:hypothetical protein